MSFTPWLPVPLFSNNFALRPGSNHRIQRATIQKLNLQEKPYISGHRNWGKELLHVGECGEYPGRAKDGERDSLILSTKSTQSWACSGVAQCQDRPQRTQQRLWELKTITHKRQDQICHLELNGLKVKVFVAQLCPTLCNSVDCSLPGFSVHGISQARILEWTAISYSRGSFWPRDWTQVSGIVGILSHLSHQGMTDC